MTKAVKEMSESELKAYIRARRELLDRQIASGEKPTMKPLHYDKKGPSIRWPVPTTKVG